MIGRKVEWRNSFRDYVGVVVSKHDADCIVYEFNEAEVYTISDNKLKISGVSLGEYAKYRERILINQTDETMSVYDLIIAELEELSGDQTFIRARNEVIENQLKLKAAAQRVCISLQSDEKFQTRFSSGDIKDSKNIESKIDINQQSRFINKNCSEMGDKEDAEEEEEEDKVNSDDDSDNDSDDSSAGDNDSEEEEDDDESGTDESDEDDTSEASSDHDTDSSDEEEDDEDETLVDIKVYVLPSNDIRGFGVTLDKNGLSTITKALKKDYGARISLFYRDSDGDVVTIKSAHDFQYAHRATVLQQQTQSSTATNNSNSDSSNISGIRLKLYAEIVIATSTTTQPSSVSYSSTPQYDSNNNTLNVSNYAQSETIPRSNGVRFTDTFDRTADYGFEIGTGVGTSIDMDSLHLLRATGSASGIGKTPTSHSPSPSVGIPTSTSTGLLNYEVMWKKGELLGRGSFGKVFSGINLSTGERMAIKEVTLRRGKKHRQQAKALQQEVKILSSLDHPHIIRYLGTEYTKQALRIFLELANEGTVKDALNEFGAFPEPLVRRYTLDILRGLHFLHQKKFIHRDIKPTNLLVSAGRVKLGDFGCSSASLEDESTLEGGGSTATVAGTVVYMAPEVMQAGEGFDMSTAASKQHPATITAAELAAADHKDSSPRGDAAAVAANMGVSMRSVRSFHHTNRPQEDKEADLDSKAAGNVTHLDNADAGVDDALHVNSARRPEKKKRRSYGKRSDIWSVGITLCEMALGKAPFSSAGAAIYAVCVSKRFPVFPELFSLEAHDFLSRCLVDDPKSRANCEELLNMLFLSAQSIEEVRAQTAATLPRTAHTTSNVTVNLPADFSFLQSPRGEDITPTAADGGGMHSARSYGRTDSSAGGWRESESKREMGQDIHSDMFASCRSRSEFSPRGTSRGLDGLLDTRDNQPHTHRDREDILLSSDAAMFRSTYASDSHTTALAGRNRRYSSGSEDSTYKNELHPILPLPLTTVSEQVEYKNTTSERISNSMEFNSHSYIQEDSVNLTILSSMALADDKRSGYREPPKELLLSENDNIKECDEDEDCKTGYSTMYSVRD